MASFSKSDIHYMRQALSLARRGLGCVAPNPAVGCVLVKDGSVVGRGFTQKGGRPHAETEAISHAGAKAKGSTAYVTLEPCAHIGKTGPCAEALVRVGVSRVVVATGDPDNRVSGRGMEILRRAGVPVDTGLLEEEARSVNEGFFLTKTEGRPLFTLKMATSLDGNIATSVGDSKWITGGKARSFGHMLRSSHDAILIGRNTALVDDPSLTCRIKGLEDRSPVRIVLDSKLSIALDSKLVKTAGDVPLWILCAKGADQGRSEALNSLGVKVLPVENMRDVAAIANLLAGEGVTRVLLEGGGQVHASFLKAGLVDRVEHFSASKVIGADGIPAIGGLDLTILKNSRNYKLARIRQLGPDLLASYAKAE